MPLGVTFLSLSEYRGNLLAHRVRDTVPSGCTAHCGRSVSGRIAFWKPRSTVRGRRGQGHSLPQRFPPGHALCVGVSPLELAFGETSQSEQCVKGLISARWPQPRDSVYGVSRGCCSPLAPTPSQKQNSLTLRTIARAWHVPIGRTDKFSCIQFVSFLPDSTPKTSVQWTHIPLRQLYRDWLIKSAAVSASHWLWGQRTGNIVSCFPVALVILWEERKPAPTLTAAGDV